MKVRKTGASEVVRFGSLFLIAMGIAVFCGWVFQWRTFLQMLAGGAFPPLGSIACLLLAGAVLWSSVGPRYALTRALSLVLVILSAANLLSPFPHTTSLVFLLLGSCAALLAQMSPPRASLHISAALAMMVLAIGTLGLLGLSAGVAVESAWVSFLTRMTVSSVLLVLISGSSLCALLWSKSRKSSQQLTTTSAILTLAGLLLLFAGIESAVYANAQSATNARKEIAFTWQQIKALRSVAESVRKAEAGQRGFLLTESFQYLEPYEQALHEIPSEWAILKSGPGELAIGPLRQLVDEKNAELAETIQFERSGRRTDALAIVRAGRGLLLMTRIDRQIALITRGLLADLGVRERTSEMSLRLMQRTLLISFVLAFILGFCGLYLVGVEMRRRSSIEDALRLSERSLEEKVAQRTALIASQTESLRAEAASRLIIEAALREADHRLRVALQFAQVAVWTWNTNEDGVTWTGPVHDVFGVDASELPSYAVFRDLIFPEDRDYIQRQIEGSLKDGSDYAAEFRIVHPDGEMHWIAGQGGVLLDATGRATRMAGVNFDVTARKAAEQKLETSERHFRELAEAMPHMVWTADPNGDVEYHSDVFYQVTGLPRGTLARDHHWRTLIHPADYDHWHSTWTPALESQSTFKAELRFWDVRTSEYRWFFCHAVPVSDASGAVSRWYGTSIDIHERKISELKLAESERVLRLREEQVALIFDTLGIGDWTWDIEKDELWAHPAVWAHYGEPEHQGPAPASWFAARYHPQDVDRTQQAVQLSLQSGAPIDVEFRIVQPDGSYRWISCRGAVVRDAGGKPIQTYGLNIDITQRKTAELRLLESERQFREQSESMPQIVWTANANGIIEYFNQRWYEHTGQSPEQTAAFDWRAVVHPDDYQAFTRISANGFYKGEPFEVHYRLRRASDGYYRWQLGRAVPYRDEDGKLLRWFGTSTDIHEQKLANEHLEAEIFTRTSALRQSLERLTTKEEELRRSLTEKETLLKEVHHRVKNNLQIISSLLRMQEGSLTDRAAIEALRESQQRVLSMALIHERLYGNKQMDEIDFGDYTHSLVNELLHSYSNPTAQVVCRFDLQRVLLNIDQAIPCGLILNELVTNALKYAYPNGNSGEVYIQLQEAGKRVALTVSDNGVGLPEGFDWRKSRSLGLPIVAILARQIGGELTVHSRRGATFVIEFPRDVKSPASAPAA